MPTIFQGLLMAAEAEGADLGFIRLGVAGGSAVPTSLMQAFERWFPLIQAWGMTETSPLGTVAFPPRGVTPDDPGYWHYRSKTGRPVPGVELRIVGPRRRAAALGRQGGGGDRGARAVDHRLLLRRRGGRALP